MWLKGEGFEVSTAPGSSEAQKVVKSGKIDAALVDYRMSKEDGIALAKKLKQIDEDIRIIILTGFPSYESAVDAMKSGIFDYISKGTPNDKILEILNSALKEREEEKKTREKRSATKNIVSLAVICDHSLIRERLRDFTRSNYGFKLVRAFSPAEYAEVKAFAGDVDVLLICAGCCLEKLKDAYILLPQLYEYLPGSKQVIINENFSDKEKVELLKLGVKGFSSRDLSSKVLGTALWRVKDGEVWVNKRTTNEDLQHMIDYNSTQRRKPENFGLTGRELEILGSIVSGLKNIRIAEELHISEKTVKTHVNHIFRKMAVHNRTQAILTAIEQNLFTIENKTNV